MAARVTWLGHSTALIELDGTRVLTDPVLRPRIAHLRRTVASDWPVVGSVDAVLISHVHYDHLDLPSLRRLGAALLVVPRGAGRWLQRRRFEHVFEVDVGDEIAVGRALVRATFAEHDSTRPPFRVRTPALGYVLSGSSRVYFAGDTDLFAGMESLAQALDVALVPVAGWGARLPAGHLDPRGAAEAVRLLGPRVAIPIHWGTYRRIGFDRDEVARRAPAEAFARFAADVAPNVVVRVLPVGGSFELEAQAPAPIADAR